MKLRKQLRVLNWGTEVKLFGRLGEIDSFMVGIDKGAKLNKILATYGDCFVKSVKIINNVMHITIKDMEAF